MLAEVVAGFDYSGLALEDRLFLEQKTSEIQTLWRDRAQNAVEIGTRLLAVKDRLKSDRTYRHWIAAEFPWAKSTANNLEHAATKFSNVQNLDNFDLSAMYLLAAPSTPEDVRQEAIAQAEAGEYISHGKARQMTGKGGAGGSGGSSGGSSGGRAGGGSFTAGQSIVVPDETSPYHGQTVQVVADEGDIVVCRGESGNQVPLFKSELQPATVAPATTPQAKAAKVDPVEGLMVTLQVEQERSKLLADLLERIVEACRNHIPILLLQEAKELLEV